MIDDDLKCTLMPIISGLQIPEDDQAWNVWPFIPITAQLKHHFYPMFARLDFMGTHFVDLNDIINMNFSTEWTKDTSGQFIRCGQPSSIQYFVNKCKTTREEACLIYFNSGVFLQIPNELEFGDLTDEEYHDLGRTWWTLWSNVPWESPRILSNEFVSLNEPSPVRGGNMRVNHRLSKEENLFLDACNIPYEWANTSNISDKSTPELDNTNQATALLEWKQINQESAAAARPIQLPIFQIQMARSNDLAGKIQIIMDEISKLNLQTDGRISMNSKVIKYEAEIIEQAKKSLTKILEFKQEKEFYDLNIKENDKLMNDFYLPQLHSILVKKKRKGQIGVEVKDQYAQYDSCDNMKDWSGQWSSDNE